jgi:acyl-CoA reductase-like NAD-dependent aldehyde dehydrogenase
MYEKRMGESMTDVSDVRRWSLRVGDEERGARGGETLEVSNPATGEVVATIPRCREVDVTEIVTVAEEAQKAWAQESPLRRTALLKELADAIDAAEGEIAHLDAIDSGIPIGYLRTDVRIATWQLRYFAGLALEIRGTTVPGEWDRIDYSVLQPYGVVARITPFNHPFMFAVRAIAAPLVAGNAVVVKPSEHTSLSSLRLAEIAADVLGPGLVNVVTGFGDEAGSPLVGHPAIKRIGFTGSIGSGQKILATAAATGVKQVSCELGGKNPIVVMSDADLEAAVDGVVNGMNFTWSSQSCGSTSRLLVERTVHDQLVEAVAERIGALEVGPPEDEATTMGSMVNRQQYEKVLGYMEIGRADGATEVVAGGPVEVEGHENGLFLRPSVFDRVDPGSRLAQEEIFGPVLSVIDFDTFEDALSIANGVAYGLTAAIYTRDLRTAHRYARDVQAGSVWINDSAKHFPGAAFGGWKASGTGRESTVEEIYSYCEAKNVNIHFE